MRRQCLLIVAFAGLLVSRAQVAPATGQAAVSGAQAEFEALVTRVRQSDESVDFLQLRRLYSESDTYTPYRDDAEASMIAAMEAGQYEAGLEIAKEILSRNYMNIEAHFAGAVACSEMQDAMCAAHHMFVARGVIQSILSSGDGKTPATAFVVVSTPEEYAVARMLRVRVQSQSLIRSDDGHAYDVLTVRDPETEAERSVYFNVDAVLAATGRVFGLR